MNGYGESSWKRDGGPRAFIRKGDQRMCCVWKGSESGRSMQVIVHTTNARQGTRSLTNERREEPLAMDWWSEEAALMEKKTGTGPESMVCEPRADLESGKTTTQKIEKKGEKRGRCEYSGTCGTEGVTRSSMYRTTDMVQSMGRRNTPSVR